MNQFETKSGQNYFWPNRALNLSKVYNFNSKIDYVIAFAVVVNPYVASFRLIGAKSILSQDVGATLRAEIKPLRGKGGQKSVLLLESIIQE